MLGFERPGEQFLETEGCQVIVFVGRGAQILPVPLVKPRQFWRRIGYPRQLGFKPFVENNIFDVASSHRREIVHKCRVAETNLARTASEGKHLVDVRAAVNIAGRQAKREDGVRGVSDDDRPAMKMLVIV